MTALTAQEIIDLQLDTDIGSAEIVFTDVELQRIHTRMGEDDYDKTKAKVIETLWYSSYKLSKYTQGSTIAEKQQIFQNLAKIVADARNIAGQGRGQMKYGTLSHRTIERS